MNARRIRVLVVDDSGFMRLAVRKMIKDTGDLEVAGEARDGMEAVELVRELKPDVVTMDIEMPRMDGLQATAEIMATTPVPVVMLSSLTQRNAYHTLEALRIGAVDFISKSSSFVQLDINKIETDLREKLRCWGRRSLQAPGEPVAPAPVPAPCRAAAPRGMPDLVVVGSSTGGPKTLPSVLTAMGAIRCPCVIAQHMPQLFTASFASNLAEQTGLPVVEGRDGMTIAPGQVVVLPGGQSSELRGRSGIRLTLHTLPGLEATVHPSADRLFESACGVARDPVAVILTGMGCDGTEGAARLAASGWPVIAQRPDTCVIDGMPASAMGRGVVSQVLGPEEVGRQLAAWAGGRAA